MTTAMRDLLWTEVRSRGFTPDGYAPNRTMGRADSYILGTEIADLLDAMVVRREKILSVNTVGQEVTKRGYDDVVLLIDAIKAVIRASCPSV